MCIRDRCKNLQSTLDISMVCVFNLHRVMYCSEERLGLLMLAMLKPFLQQMSLVGVDSQWLRDLLHVFETFVSCRYNGKYWFCLYDIWGEKTVSKSWLPEVP